VSLLLDTTVLVDLVRGRREAREFIKSHIHKLSVSVVTVAELYAGIREGPQRRFIEQLRLTFEFVPVDDQIAEMAGDFRRRFGKSHGVTIPDALIAASSVQVGAKLVTHNVKHFPMIDDVLVPY
jgi:predicted nucleic acid-binding protein